MAGKEEVPTELKRRVSISEEVQIGYSAETDEQGDGNNTPSWFKSTTYLT